MTHGPSRRPRVLGSPGEARDAQGESPSLQLWGPPDGGRGVRTLMHVCFLIVFSGAPHRDMAQKEDEMSWQG